MNCNIARDLLASYNDGLLEEETVKELEAHLKDCPDCKKLNDVYGAQVGTKKEMPEKPDKDKAFGKVKRTIKKNRIIAVVCGVVASLMVLFAVVLTIGQIIKYESFPSWEMLIQQAEVRGIAKSFAEGDMESFYRHMYRKIRPETDFYKSYRPAEISEESMTILSGDDLLDTELVSKMQEAYKNEFEGRKVKRIRTEKSVYCDFSGFTGLHEVLGSVVFIEMEDGGKYYLEFMSMGNSDYRIEVLYHEDDDLIPENSELANVCNFATKVVDPEAINDYLSGTLSGCMRVLLTTPEDDYYMYTKSNGEEVNSSKSYEKFVKLNGSGLKTDYCDTGIIWYDTKEDKYVSSWLAEVNYEGESAFIRFSVEYSPECTFIRKGTVKTYNNGVPEDKLEKLNEIFELYER